MSREQNARFWERRAREETDPRRVTHADLDQRMLEIAAIGEQLRRSDRVLDVGCGNAFATAALARRCAAVLGLDRSETMIEQARALYGQAAGLSFEVADVMDLTVAREFDVVLSQRCLINLLDWDCQQEAIRRLARALRPGGRLLLMEGIADGRRALNALRESVGLDPMPPVPHNLDLPLEETLRLVRSLFEQVHARGFGVYDLLTRVVHPMTMAPQPPAYGTPLHEAAAKLALALNGYENISHVRLIVASDPREDVGSVFHEAGVKA